MLKRLYHKLWSNVGKFVKEESYVKEDGVISEFNILYGEDEKNNVYDVFYPNVLNEKLPAIVMFHGGGYVSGENRGTRNFCEQIAKKGFLVFNMEYTKCDKAESKYFPNQVFEFFEFYKSISTNPKFENIIDFNNFFLAGDSAGGHIASLIANIQTNQELKMEFGLSGGPKVKGVILMSPSFGVYKFKGLFPKSDYHNVVFGKKRVRHPLADYCHNLDVTTEGFPPVLMFSCKKDPVVGIHKGMFLNLARELNLSVKHFEICSGYKLFHSSMISYATHYTKCFDEIEEFVHDAVDNKFVNGVVNTNIFEESGNHSQDDFESVPSRIENEFIENEVIENEIEIIA